MEEERNDFQVEISREGKEKSSSDELDAESKESHPKEKKKSSKKLKEEGFKIIHKKKLPQVDDFEKHLKRF